MAESSPESVRVAAVQWAMRGIDSIEAFERQVEYWVDAAAGYEADFLLFPELFTMQLLSMTGQRLDPAEAMARTSAYTARFCELMAGLAVSRKVNVIGGSHPTRVAGGDIRNVAHVFLRDGTVHAREKLHPTPSERECWGISGGADVDVIMTDRGPIGVMICYDSEFPELARHLVDQGALLLFVPYCTDDRRGHLRVRYCCQARAVENQCHVVTAGVTGNLPNVLNMDIHYAQSAILTPCDFAFARDGIAAEATANAEAMIIADLSLADLLASRQTGSVRNLADRRADLYRVDWLG